MTPAPSEVPWTHAQARTVAACDLLAALVIVVAGYAAGQEASLRDQITWLNLGVVGLLGAFVANGLVFLLARRAVGQRRLRVIPDVIGGAVPATQPAGERAGWLWLPGTTRAHLDGCPMIVGKPTMPISAAGVRSNALTRCEMCG